MPKPSVLAVAGLVAAIAFGGGVIQAQHRGHDKPETASGHAAAHDHSRHAAGADTRVPVAIPEPLRTHMLANMRDHLLALHEIQAALARNDTTAAGRIAEQRLGMSSLQSHGAHEVGQFMPKGMQEAGTAMHRSASRFAIAAQDAGVTGNLSASLQALSDVTAACVGCHAGYRIK